MPFLAVYLLPQLLREPIKLQQQRKPRNTGQQPPPPFFHRPSSYLWLQKEPSPIALSRTTVAHEKTLAQALEQINAAVGISPFIVVPTQDLNHVTLDYVGREGVKNARVCVANNVG